MVFATVIMPIATALVELVKRTISTPKNIVPLLSFIVGLIVGVIAYPFTDLDLALRLWAGGLAGLAGTGLFEITMNRREGNTK